MTKFFCNYPWRHTYVEANGRRKLCCMSKDYITKDNGYNHFDMSKDHIVDGWNGNYMKNIRRSMINGERLSTCEKCLSIEDSGVPSMRSTQGQASYLEQTSADGSYPHFPKSVELHFGNICNLRCKMCSSWFSHSIGKELMKIGEEDPDFIDWIKKENANVNNWTPEFEKVYDWFTVPKIKRSVFDYVSNHVEHLNVVGGEPTVIPEFYELLEYCHNQGTLKNKFIQLITNVTNTNPKLTSWLSDTERFYVHCSVDGLEERNKYIRYPADWNTVLKSIDFYKYLVNKHHNKDKCTVYVASSWQSLNIDQLIDYTKFFNEKEVGVAFMPKVVSPIICNYSTLPVSYRKEIKEKLQAQFARLKTSNDYQTDNIEKIIKHLDVSESEDVERQNYILKCFTKYNDTLDKHRPFKSWRDLLPDLERHIIQAIGQQ
jgi:MoaA/NifB/PqqE/SkfB family radical SAM enzyme